MKASNYQRRKLFNKAAQSFKTGSVWILVLGILGSIGIFADSESFGVFFAGIFSTIIFSSLMSGLAEIIELLHSIDQKM